MTFSLTVRSIFIFFIAFFSGCAIKHKCYKCDGTQHVKKIKKKHLSELTQHLSPKETLEKIDALIQEGQEEVAAEVIEKNLNRFTDHAEVTKLKIKGADCHFNLKHYAVAGALYENFYQHYPTHKQAEYSRYRSILCKFHQTLRPECDQTMTEQTLQACKEYENNPEYTTYRTDVAAINKTCTYKLIDKEIYVFNFYLKQDQIEPAAKRLSTLKNTYLSKYPELEPRILYLELKLAHKKQPKEGLEEPEHIMKKLFSKYPESTYARMVQSSLQKKL